MYYLPIVCVWCCLFTAYFHTYWVYILYHQTNKQTNKQTSKQRLAFTYVHKCRSSNRPWCFSGGRSHVYPGRESVRWDRTCSTGCSGHRHSVCPVGCLHVAALAAPTPAGSCSATKHHLQWRRRITTGAFIFSVCLSLPLCIGLQFKEPHGRWALRHVHISFMLATHSLSREENL